MEDLDNAGYGIGKKQADWPSLKVAIRWLAYFHIKFIGKNPLDLWPVGSYWHLATRQDELKAMPASVYKTSAVKLAQHLANAKFQSLIHVDAKFENLCFHNNGQTVAAVDFQYVGRGAGVKDLAYLAGSCLSSEQLFHYDERVVDEYLHQAHQAITHYQTCINVELFAKEVRTLYPVAWADFYRFLLGWNPQSGKIGDYMKHQANIGLEQINLDKH